MSLTDAQQALAQTMSDISEFCWFARWMSGTEYRLWRFVTDPNDDEPWGNYPIPPSTASGSVTLAKRLEDGSIGAMIAAVLRLSLGRSGSWSSALGGEGGKTT